MQIQNKLAKGVKRLNTPKNISVLFVLCGSTIFFGLNFNSYSSRFEAEVACNRSSHYCHHDKETRQILGLDYQETKEFKLGWPVMQRYRY